jgi:hypothetical protein
MCGLLDSPLGNPAADEQSAQFLQIFDRRRLATVQMWLAQAVVAAAKLDAKAWGVTWLPTL